jgi:hypothetical protein
MNWIKKGLIFSASGQYPWMQSHTQLPTVDRRDDKWRIYFGTRDTRNRSVVSFIDVNPENPAEVLYVSDHPALSLGDLGCFDDSGVIPSSIVEHAGINYLYYIGVNVGTTVPYRYSIGLAVSYDDGSNFIRKFMGPVMDRTPMEPQLCTCPCVCRENGHWRMWYSSCLRWDVLANKPEPIYHVRYCESTDGVTWERKGRVCVDFASTDEGGIGRPSVLRGHGLYRMWFSYRDAEDYRTNKSHSYRIGYAESTDGIEWTRNDSLVGIDVSESGWDSEMIAYPYLFEHKGRVYMFYNGNGFGRSGLGYAVLEEGTLGERG